MANKKITELTAYINPIVTDVLPIVDVTTSETKKITYAELTNQSFGSFSSNANQTIASTTTAYAITYSNTELTNNITLSNNSRINIAYAGTYLITFSAIGETSSANKHLDIWLAVGGANIARTNTITEFTTANNERIVTVTFLYTFTAGQYFELMMRGDSTSVFLKATGTQTNPTRPACPSIIVTVNRIG